jgi:hypothetical protein
MGEYRPRFHGTGEACEWCGRPATYWIDSEGNPSQRNYHAFCDDCRARIEKGAQLR